MAIKKKPKPNNPKPKPPQKKPNPKPEVLKKPPEDYLRGSKTVGGKYTAWNTYGAGKPDFGKSAGPGDPYHEVEKRVRKPLPIPKGGQKPTLPWGPPKVRTTLPARNNVGLPQTNDGNMRMEAIRRRLGWK